MEPDRQPADHAAEIDRLVRLTATSDRLSASLRIERGCPPNEITPGVLASILDEQTIGHGCRDAAAISALIEAFNNDPDRAHEAVVARGTPPVAGDDAEFTFSTQIESLREQIARRTEALKDLDESATDALSDPDSAGGVDFYNQSAFVVVRPGEVIGHFSRQTDGIDGTDIYCAAIAAAPGAACPVHADQAVRTTETGEAIAIGGGLVELADNRLRVEPTLTVREPVSFATGNIDFPGDVVLNKGVRDRFVVGATGGITVAELVEAATIRCEGTLKLNGGMAGRSSGSIRAGRDLHAHYLDAISGLVIGSATIDREISNCELTIEGMLDARACTIRGGSLVVARRIEIAALGCEAGTPTALTLGSLPQLNALATGAIALLAELDAAPTGSSELDALRALPKRTADQIEQLMELEFASENTGDLRLRLRVAIDRIIASMAASTIVSLTVHGRIHAGASLSMPGWRADFETDLPGPVLIELDENGRAVYGDPKAKARRPLEAAARCTPDEAVPDPAQLMRELEQSDQSQAA